MLEAYFDGFFAEGASPAPFEVQPREDAYEMYATTTDESSSSTWSGKTERNEEYYDQYYANSSRRRRLRKRLQRDLAVGRWLPDVVRISVRRSDGDSRGEEAEDTCKRLAAELRSMPSYKPFASAPAAGVSGIEAAFVALANDACSLLGAPLRFARPRRAPATHQSLWLDEYRPGIIFGPKGASSFSAILTCGEVRRDAARTWATVMQLSRGMALLRRNAGVTAACHGFTLCRETAQLQLYRFDAQLCSAAKVLQLSRAEDMPDFIKLVAFLSNEREVLVRWRPSLEFEMRPDWQCDASTAVQEPGRETWHFRAAPQRLIARSALFGRRTTCWAGEARLAGSDGDYRSVVLKTTWIDDYLVGHEAKVLHHLRHVDDVPKLAGTLVLPPAVHRANEHSSARIIERDEARRSAAGDEAAIPERWEHGLGLDALVMFCPVGREIDCSTPPADVLQLFDQAAKILRDVSAADVHYRDLNTGNLLQVDMPGGGVRAMLIDFGNARIGDLPRGTISAEDETARCLRLALDDSRSANMYFMSRRSMDAADAFGSLAFHQDDLRDSRKEYDSACAKGRSEDELQLLRQDIESAERRVQDFQEDVHLLAHRALDDLESLYYLLLYQSARRVMLEVLQELEKIEFKKMMFVDEPSELIQLQNKLRVHANEWSQQLLPENLMQLVRNNTTVTPRTPESGILMEHERKAFNDWITALDIAAASIRAQSGASSDVSAPQLPLKISSPIPKHRQSAALKEEQKHGEKRKRHPGEENKDDGKGAEGPSSTSDKP